jgi:biotin transporter BioY
MLMYLVVFFIIGFIVAKIVKEKKKAFLIFICIAVLWGIVYVPMWGFVSLAEMLLGYFVVSFTKD